MCDLHQHEVLRVFVSLRPKCASGANTGTVWTRLQDSAGGVAVRVAVQVPRRGHHRCARLGAKVASVVVDAVPKLLTPVRSRASPGKKKRRVRGRSIRSAGFSGGFERVRRLGSNGLEPAAIGSDAVRRDSSRFGAVVVTHDILRRDSSPLTGTDAGNVTHPPDAAEGVPGLPIIPVKPCRVTGFSGND